MSPKCDQPTIPPKDRAEEGILWLICSNNLGAGDRLPAERVLCERLGVSRTALRGAIEKLVAAHYLESRRGSGTYVCPPKPLNVFEHSYNFSESVSSMGLTPSSHVVSTGVYPAGRSLSEKLALPEGAPVFELVRVRLADGQPVSIETAYVNKGAYPGIEDHDFSHESLYDVLRDEYQTMIHHGEERIGITRVNAMEAALLGVEEGSSVLFETALELDDNHNTVEYMKSVILPGRYQFASDSFLGDSSDASAGLREVGDEWLRMA